MTKVRFFYETAKCFDHNLLQIGGFCIFLLKYFVIWAESINFAGDYYPTLSKICASINISPER